MIRKIIFGIIAFTLISCTSKKKEYVSVNSYSDITIVGAMKNVMWKGQLSGYINLDTISNKKGLYGIGPESYLKGEILINNGVSYVSKVTSDTTMTVERKDNVSAPFFVYSNIIKWDEFDLSSDIKTIQDIEKLIDNKTIKFKRPFAFKLNEKYQKLSFMFKIYQMVPRYLRQKKLILVKPIMN